MERADVIILGGGLIGLTLALALDANGLEVLLVDPADPEAQAAPGHDGRATAMSSSSWRMLEALGIAETLAPHACPIAEIRVADGLAPGSLSFRPKEGDGPHGMMIENARLRAALREAVTGGRCLLWQPAVPAKIDRGADGVRLVTADGREARGALLVGAEGRGSPSREAAGIALARWRYDHQAIVTTITHERPHETVAWEIFYPDGPFAILPLLDHENRHRSAIVWSAARASAPALEALPNRAFAHELHKRMGGFLGAVEAEGRRWRHDLGFHHAARITDTRLALVGDAAHGIHPIAGQGLNLGFRDVAALAEVLIEGRRLGMDPGDAQLLARYQAWRSLDTLMVAAATDGLTRLFGVRGRAASSVRRFGMRWIERIGPLRDRLAAEARGETGALPRLLQGFPI